ncbi:MAG: hypothetical protein R6W82_11660 [bacterium]
MRKVLLAAVLLIGSGTPAGAFQAGEPDASGEGNQRLHVFLDVQARGLDRDYIRTELDWVDWVRDRRDADVHILITTQSAGSGGRAYTFDFMGRGRFESLEDTLTYTSSQTDTQDEVRQEIARVLRMGLVPYLMRTPMAGRIDLDLEMRATEEEAITPQEDPWDYWIFRARLSGDIEEEASSSERSVDGSFSARRITRDWKSEFEVQGDYGEDRRELSGGEVITNFTHDLEFDGLIVKSLGPHFSAGVRWKVSSDTRTNQRLNIRGAPALEWSLYPYSEFTRRQITFQYTIGSDYFDYYEETIFGHTGERQMEQALEISLDFTQPWGTARTSLEASHYFSDLNKYRLTLFSSWDIRLLRGFSLNLFGRGSRIHDQLYIPSREASDEEVLLRIRRLQTNYDFEFRVGLSFTFGSIFNPIVNPRLDQGGGRHFR